MSGSALSPSRMTRFALEAENRFAAIALVAITLALIGFTSPEPLMQKVFLAGACALVALCSGLIALVMRHRLKSREALTVLSGFLENDAAASMVTDADGCVLYGNVAAQKRLNCQADDTLIATLNRTLANPAAMVFRLRAHADSNGSAQEDIVTSHGHVRVSVHLTGAGQYVWRIEDIPSDFSKVDAVPLPMLIVDRDDTVLRTNDEARRLIGDNVKSLDRLFSGQCAAGEACSIATRSGVKEILLTEVAIEEGRRALFLLPRFNEQAGTEGWSVFQNLPVPLLKITPDGTVGGHNRMAAELIGNTLQEQVHLSQVMEGLGRSITDWLRETLAGKASQSTEFLRLKRVDKETFVQVTLNRVEENGAPALIAVLNDATELKTLEAQFVQSQKMQAIGQLAGGVAHDFNNLLTAISGHCDLLLLRHDQGDPDYSDLVQINQNANRAAALVGQLLAFSRKQTLRPETLDMRDTLSDLTHLLNRLVGEKVSLTLTHDPILQPIRADKRQLEQVLMNLVVNARDAMPTGGEIRIETHCTTLKEPLARDRVVVPVGQYVTVQVSDEGCGIPSDKLQKVFEPFFTTKRTGEGTGLGLSTAYGIVKQTGGYIFVDSKPGMGTSFTLYFPVLEASEAAPVEKKISLPKATGKHSDGVILLVEDEAPVRAFASRALRLRGYTVIEADSAEAALKTLEDESLNVDVFVTDVVMPGMDGPSWVRQALEQRPDVRVVFVSGYAEDSFGEMQTRIPNSVFLPKPFSLNDLTETVHEQLH